jgi:hypothetical protein
MFDMISLRDEFIGAIREIFANEYDTLNSEVEILTNENQKASFPSCVVKIINPITDKRYVDSDDTYNIISLSLNCDLYSKELEDFSLEDSVIMLSQILINGILKKYKNFEVTRNSEVPYRSDTKRITVTFLFDYDNKNKIIYSN